MKRSSVGLLALMACLGAPHPLHAAETPTPATSALLLTPTERRFFDLGYQLGRAAFAYAELGKHAAEAAQASDKLERLAALAPLAARDRTDARDGFVRAGALMKSLGASPGALGPVGRAAARLTKPLAPSGDARRVAAFSRRAAQTLASLDEFNALSSVPENPALQHWLAATPSGRVWYAEGLIAALAETAAAQQMPELLPPVKEIATDLRGLRDWLSLRLPETPTPDQAALEAALEDFLRETSRTGRPQTTLLSSAQLQSLGDISRRLQAQVLGSPAAAPIPPKDTPDAPDVTG